MSYSFERLIHEVFPRSWLSLRAPGDEHYLSALTLLSLSTFPLIHAELFTLDCTQRFRKGARYVCIRNPSLMRGTLRECGTDAFPRSYRLHVLFLVSSRHLHLLSSNSGTTQVGWYSSLKAARWRILSCNAWIL